jgi:hypothetical protein
MSIPFMSIPPIAAKATAFGVILYLSSSHNSQPPFSFAMILQELEQESLTGRRFILPIPSSH